MVAAPPGRSEEEPGVFLPSSNDRIFQIVQERLRVDPRKSPGPAPTPSAREIAHYRAAPEAMHA